MRALPRAALSMRWLANWPADVIHDKKKAPWEIDWHAACCEGARGR